MELTVDMGRIHQPIFTLTGDRGAVVLFVPKGLQNIARCRKMRSLERHKGILVVEIRFPEGRENKCGLTSHVATSATVRAWKDKRALLPLAVVADGKGKVFKLLSGEPNLVRVEAAVLDLLN